MNKYLGTTNFETRVITLLDNGDEEGMRKTLLHELIHVLYEAIKIQHEEKDVLLTESMLWQMLVDNKSEWDWIINGSVIKEKTK